MGGYGLAVPEEAFLVVDLGDGPKFLRRGRAKAEELEIGRNLFKQHIGADLNFTATRLCGRQKWRNCFITTSPTNVEGEIRSTSIGNGSSSFLPRGVALTTTSNPAGSLEPTSIFNAE